MRQALIFVLAIAFGGVCVPAVAQELYVERSWVRAVGPAAKTAAIYMTIENRTDSPVRLTGVATPAAAHAMLHRTELSADGVMRMRSAADGVLIPAHGKFQLAPGGYHVMLMGLSAALAPGANVPVTLTFDTGATVPVTAVVGEPD